MEVTGGGDMDPGAQCQGTIAREETQLLLADAGEVMTQQRVGRKRAARLLEN